MKEKDLKEFSDKIIAQGDGITKVEIFINGEKKWEHHAIPVTERIKTYEDACRPYVLEYASSRLDYACVYRLPPLLQNGSAREVRREAIYKFIRKIPALKLPETVNNKRK